MKTIWPSYNFLIKPNVTVKHKSFASYSACPDLLNVAKLNLKTVVSQHNKLRVIAEIENLLMLASYLRTVNISVCSNFNLSD